MRRALWSTFTAILLLLAVTAGVAQSPAFASRGRSHARANRDGSRAWSITIATPTPPDYALAQIDVAASASTPVRMRAREPLGADYIAAAKVSGIEGRLRIVAFVLDRPTAAMIPADIHLSLRLPRSAGRPRTVQVRDGLAARQGPPPALCDLQTGSEPLEADGLRPVLSTGAALSGFSALQAIAQGYDLSCGLDFEASFEEGVLGGPSPTPPACPPCTPTTVCTPCVSPPAPCAPCDPLPAHACPMTAQPAICVAPRESLLHAA